MRHPPADGSVYTGAELELDLLQIEDPDKGVFKKIR
jgi:hypothetical protein